MDNSTTTEQTQNTSQTITTQSDIMLPLESGYFTTSISSTTNFNTIFDQYFNVFPPYYLFLIIGIGISLILLYTLYSYLENI